MILFADDNVMIHRGYALELFTRMAPLKKHWIGQCSLAAVKRIENIKLMAESGCKALFIGFESVDDETVLYTGKRQNKPGQYKEVVDMLRDHGIAVWGSFVFGFDTDGLDCFDRTVEFAIDAKLTMALFAILTPYPGTALYRRLLAEGRLTDPQWWMRRDHDAGSPYYRPAKMTREQLREGWMRAWTSFYSYSSMWKRYAVNRRSSWIQALGFWPLNILQNRLAHVKIVGGMQRFRSGVQIEDGVTLPTAEEMAELVAPLPEDVPQQRLNRLQVLR